jgi:hypothetical protein
MSVQRDNILCRNESAWQFLTVIASLPLLSLRAKRGNLGGREDMRFFATLRMTSGEGPE